MPHSRWQHMREWKEKWTHCCSLHNTWKPYLMDLPTRWICPQQNLWHQVESAGKHRHDDQSLHATQYLRQCQSRFDQVHKLQNLRHFECLAQLQQTLYSLLTAIVTMVDRVLRAGWSSQQTLWIAFPCESMKVTFVLLQRCTVRPAPSPLTLT